LNQVEMNHSDKHNAHDNPKAGTGRVIPMYPEAGHIEREIDEHVKSIRALISKLRPSDRQAYFTGLLSHLLKDELTGNNPAKSYPAIDADYDALSGDDLSLIRELSGHLHKLYIETGGD
ncbi:MAG: hypothetical protein ACKO1U_07635, partial [Bacteroidota bacterium]